MTNSPPYWQDAIAHLSKNDRIMAELIQKYPQEKLTCLGNPFQTLIRAVIGQQVSVKSAESSWQKLKQKLVKITPNDFFNLTEEELIQCGLTRQKRAYLKNIANAFEQSVLTPNQWQEMNDEEVIKQLVQIKGIGPWTAQMFLIFYLNRADVFPIADIGIINAVKLNYGDSTKEQILTRSLDWKPYRTVASWYLWLSLDPLTVQY